MKKLIFFLATAIVFSACAGVSDKELDAPYLREPIFIDAKDRQGYKIAFFSIKLQNDYKDGLIVKNDDRELQLRDLRADIIFILLTAIIDNLA